MEREGYEGREIKKKREEEDERRPMSMKKMEEADASRYRETRMERESVEGMAWSENESEIAEG